MSSPAATPEAQQAQTREQVLLGALAVALAMQTDPAESSTLSLPLLAELGVAPVHAIAALSLLTPNLERRRLEPGDGPAVQSILIAEPAYSATYLVNAARRLAAGRRSAAQERRHLAQHLEAARARFAAAREADRAARRYGRRLGWYSMLDARTTPECRRAHGNNFMVGEIPAIGYPGSLHGGTCRCRPGPPYAKGGLVDDVVREHVHDLSVDLAFDPDQPRDHHGRWRRWLGGLRRGNLQGHGNPGEHPPQPRDPRAADEAARIVAFPDIGDAIDAQRLGAELAGQEPQPLERRAALEGALARPRNYAAYGGDLADAAAALAHGVSQSQAFTDGNKRVALALTFHFLLENGHRLDADQARILTDHIGGYGEGTHTLDDTARWLRSVLSRPHPGT